MIELSEKDVYRNILAQKGLRVTDVRIKVLKILDDAEILMTVEEVFTGLRSMLSSVNLSTVYRTMEAFIKNGLIIKPHCWMIINPGTNIKERSINTILYAPAATGWYP